MFFILMGDRRDFHGIGLLNVLWKTIMGLLNRSFTLESGFHDVLHGFQAGRGTGNTSLKAKLLQQIMAMRETVINNIAGSPDSVQCTRQRQLS